MQGEPWVDGERHSVRPFSAPTGVATEVLRPLFAFLPAALLVGDVTSPHVTLAELSTAMAKRDRGFCFYITSVAFVRAFLCKRALLQHRELLHVGAVLLSMARLTV